MKDFRGMKRQRSRNRKPSGNSNNPNRAYESNGPEGTKVRGNAQTIYEKYQQLARDANSSGDRVLAENHLQHAEHYFRLIRQMQPQRPVSEFVQRDPFSNGFDFDDEDLENEGMEGEAETMGGGDDAQPVMDEARYDGGQNRNGNDRNGNDRNRDRDRNNGDRNNGDRNRDRNNGDRNNGNRDRDGRAFENRGNADRNNGNGQDRNLADRNVADRGPVDNEGFDGRRETRRERYERRRSQRLVEQEQNVNLAPNGYTAAPTSDVVAPSYIAPTEPLNARPAAPQPAPAVDADHLPAFLRTPTPVSAPAPEPVAEAAAEDAPKPRRGRPKRKAEEAAAEEA